MGDHDTWYSLFEAWHSLEAYFRAGLERDWKWMAFADTHYTLVHVGSALIAVALILVATYFWRGSIEGGSKGVVPTERYGLAAMLDGFINATFQFASDIMGEDTAKRYLPFVGTLALFIFCMNIQGLVPGFLPGTDTLKTNLALSLVVFFVYNVVGMINQGPLNYLAHFAGPKFELGGISLRWLAPLMVPIELASHIARPVSLALRLMGNILADHKVVGAILLLVPLVIPVPFLLLGVMVAIVQTVVFTLLTMIYIGEAAAHHAEDH